MADPDDLRGHVELVRAAVRAAVDALAPEDLVGALGRRARQTQRAAPLSPVAQTEAATRIADLGSVRLRAHLSAEVRDEDDGTAVLVSRAATVTLTAPEAYAARHLLVAGGLAVGDLGTDLARRLLLAGVVVPG